MSALKHFFIPHCENNYHPHVLHHKRILFYGFLGIMVKAVAVLTALLLPAQAFVIPEVLVAEQGRIIELTNEIRAREGRSPLSYAEKLGQSSLHKAEDMARNNYFEHIGPDGRRLRDFLRDVQYPYSVAGENLAVGFASPEDAVEAWVESPTHFANLIDADFVDIGVGGSVGMYGNASAVYLVQHFGNPKPGSVSETPAPSRERVRGVSSSDTESLASSEPYYDFGASYLHWVSSEGIIELTARARIVGDADRVTVRAQGYEFELSRTYEENLWSGTLTIAKSYAEFFKAVLSPEISILWSPGTSTESIIQWDTLPEVSLTNTHKYELTRMVPAVLGSLATGSQGILYGMIAFFSVALAIKIFVEIRHQHYHVIASTLLLLTLLSLLVIV